VNEAEPISGLIQSLKIAQQLIQDLILAFELEKVF